MRASSEDAAKLLTERFADRHEPSAEPPGNLSLWLAAPSAGATQDLHRLYETYARALRTRSVTRALGALWHELDQRDLRATGRQLLADVTTVVDVHGRAHLLNRRWRRRIVDDERRWQRAGFRLVERRWATIDPQAGTVSAPPAPASLGEAALGERIATLGVDHRAEGVLQAGSWPIVSWTMETRPLTRAQQVALAAGSVLDLRGPAGVTVVRGVARLLAELPELHVETTSFDELSAGLAQLSSDAGA